jgi:hypothetical protein
MIDIIFKNNAMIRILAIELLNPTLVLVLMIKSLLEDLWCPSTTLAPRSVYRELKKDDKLRTIEYYW